MFCVTIQFFPHTTTNFCQFCYFFNIWKEIIERVNIPFLFLLQGSTGPGVIIVNIILCNYVCFPHVTIINNLLTYLLITFPVYQLVFLKVNNFFKDELSLWINTIHIVLLWSSFNWKFKFLNEKSIIHWLILMHKNINS